MSRLGNLFKKQGQALGAIYEGSIGDEVRATGGLLDDTYKYYTQPTDEDLENDPKLARINAEIEKRRLAREASVSGGIQGQLASIAAPVTNAVTRGARNAGVAEESPVARLMRQAAEAGNVRPDYAAAEARANSLTNQAYDPLITIQERNSRKAVANVGGFFHQAGNMSKEQARYLAQAQRGAGRDLDKSAKMISSLPGSEGRAVLNDRSLLARGAQTDIAGAQRGLMAQFGQAIAGEGAYAQRDAQDRASDANQAVRAQKAQALLQAITQGRSAAASEAQAEASRRMQVQQQQMRILEMATKGKDGKAEPTDKEIQSKAIQTYLDNVKKTGDPNISAAAARQIRGRKDPYLEMIIAQDVKQKKKSASEE